MISFWESSDLFYFVKKETEKKVMKVIQWNSPPPIFFFFLIYVKLITCNAFCVRNFHHYI